MSLAAGTRLGSYEVVSSLGAGGMGEVYRAKDSKLKRDVALKVLPADVGTDRERLARFQREAEVPAALNHPQIAQIFGLEESEGTTALRVGHDAAVSRLSVLLPAAAPLTLGYYPGWPLRSHGRLRDGLRRTDQRRSSAVDRTRLQS